MHFEEGQSAKQSDPGRAALKFVLSNYTKYKIQDMKINHARINNGDQFSLKENSVLVQLLLKLSV